MIKVASEYNIVRAPNPAELIRNVSIAVRGGFEPQGGVVVYDQGFGPIFAQTVVRYEFVSEMEYARRRAQG